MIGKGLTGPALSRGILVQFLIRDGQLCSWSQRSCSHPGSTDALAATPAAWRDFTRRNAELAARLTQ
jgi:hypothetical protein